MGARKAQHQEWDEELTVYLTRIVFCERCKFRLATDKAHRLKRRFIGWRTDLDRLEYFMAVKLCRVCHKDLDEYTGNDPHQRMFVLITLLVLRRSRGMVTGPYVEPHPQRQWDAGWVNDMRRQVT